MFKLELRNQTEGQAAARSRLYGLFMDGFQFPTPELYEKIKTGRFGQEITDQLQGLPYKLKAEVSWGKDLTISLADFQGKYMELFELGGPTGVPIFLYEGQYSGSVTKAMEEVLAFYHYFGLCRSPNWRERPDHIAVEFQFMHYLTYKETEAAAKGSNMLPYVKAQEDFLRLHLLDFVSAVAERHGSTEVPFYSDLVLCAGGFCQKEMACVMGLAKEERR